MSWLDPYFVNDGTALVPLSKLIGQPADAKGAPPPDEAEAVQEAVAWLGRFGAIPLTNRAQRIGDLLESIGLLATAMREQRGVVLRAAIALHFLVESEQYKYICDQKGEPAFRTAAAFEQDFLRREGLGGSAGRLHQVRRGAALWLALRQKNLPLPETLGRTEPLLALPVSTAIAVFQREAELAAAADGQPVVPDRERLEQVARKLMGQRINRPPDDPDVARREVLGKALRLARSIQSGLNGQALSGEQADQVHQNLLQQLAELAEVLQPKAAATAEGSPAWSGQSRDDQVIRWNQGSLVLVEHWTKLECRLQPADGEDRTQAERGGQLAAAVGDFLTKYGWKKVESATGPTWVFTLPTASAAGRARAVGRQLPRAEALVQSLTSGVARPPGR